MSGVSIEGFPPTRQYDGGTIAPHIIGSTGLLSAEEYEALDEAGETYSSDNIAGYAYNDTIGKSGIEAARRTSCAAKTGRSSSAPAPTETFVDTTDEWQAPVNGNTVYLTLDSNLQAVASASLAEKRGGRPGGGEEEQKADRCRRRRNSRLRGGLCFRRRRGASRGGFRRAGGGQLPHL